MERDQQHIKKVLQISDDARIAAWRYAPTGDNEDHGAQIDLELDEVQCEPAEVMLEAVAYQKQS